LLTADITTFYYILLLKYNKAQSQN